MPPSAEETQTRKYYARYELLNNKTVPFNAFVKDTLPYPSKRGEITFNRALALRRDWSSLKWMLKLTERSKYDRENCQVVYLPPRDPDNPNRDFSEEFRESVANNQLGKYPMARLERQEYKGDTGDYGRKIIGKRKVKTVYIVGSVVTDSDVADVIHVASQYKFDGEDVQVNLVSPFLKAERDDKSMELLENKKRKVRTGKIPSINPTLEQLSVAVDNIFTFETHSSATQAFASIHGMDLIPISVYDDLIKEVEDLIVDPKEWRIVRPDVGRNMIAQRISKLLHIKAISLSKFRKGDDLESRSSVLTGDETKALKDRNALLYDDEAGTFGTVKDVTINHLAEAGVKSINILLGHARLQRGWDRNLEEMLKVCDEKKIPLRIFITDTRVPVGDLSSFMEKHKGLIKLVPIAQKTRKVIEAAIEGTDFFHSNDWHEGEVDWERLVLQAIPGHDFKIKAGE